MPALGALEAVRGKALGVIFNRVARRDSQSGYYGGYYQSTARDETSKARTPPESPVGVEDQVTGPSLTNWTCMSAPKRPRDTLAPSASSAEHCS